MIGRSNFLNPPKCGDLYSLKNTNQQVQELDKVSFLFIQTRCNSTLTEHRGNAVLKRVLVERLIDRGPAKQQTDIILSNVGNVRGNALKVYLKFIFYTDDTQLFAQLEFEAVKRMFEKGTIQLCKLQMKILYDFEVLQFSSNLHLKRLVFPSGAAQRKEKAVALGRGGGGGGGGRERWSGEGELYDFVQYQNPFGCSVVLLTSSRITYLLYNKNVNRMFSMYDKIPVLKEQPEGGVELTNDSQYIPRDLWSPGRNAALTAEGSPLSGGDCVLTSDRFMKYETNRNTSDGRTNEPVGNNVAGQKDEGDDGFRMERSEDRRGRSLRRNFRKFEGAKLESAKWNIRNIFHNISIMCCVTTFEMIGNKILISSVECTLCDKFPVSQYGCQRITTALIRQTETSNLSTAVAIEPLGIFVDNLHHGEYDTENKSSYNVA
ncbi:hypothetical protein WN51_14012 [Melipona quadrifasciata]|uniref:Uncharacterized protein n=1 Tax=Melipona quadrifasciata TaxID=166423 RepID=A0A0N0BFW4_9HYME|nr:hypothetical protein WN51_14012 [Melipona quadrifasciata]